DVTLVHRDPIVIQEIKKNGIKLQDLDGTLTKVSVPVQMGPTRLPGTEVLIVAVKAYDTRALATSYRGRILPETTVMSLQNTLSTGHSQRGNEPAFKFDQTPQWSTSREPGDRRDRP